MLNTMAAIRIVRMQKSEAGASLFPFCARIARRWSTGGSARVFAVGFRLEHDRGDLHQLFGAARLHHLDHLAALRAQQRHADGREDVQAAEFEVGGVRINDRPGGLFLGRFVEQRDLRVHRDDVCLDGVGLNDIGAFEQRVEHRLEARIVLGVLFEASDVEFGQLVKALFHGSSPNDRQGQAWRAYEDRPEPV